MSHAHHFLERLDRVDREQTEFALSLYNDHEAVAFVLGRVNLPEGTERVALAVDTSSDGPVVLVTRDGKFVTCLGRGMRHDHPVVPRQQLDALLAKVADKRARRELLQRERRPDEENKDILQRVFTRGSRLSREDFLVLTAFEPMLGVTPFLFMMEIGADALKTRALVMPHAHNLVVKGSSMKAIERLHRMEWAVAHLALLSGAADRRELDAFLDTRATGNASGTFACSAQGGMTFYLRAAWVAARFGKPVVPVYKAAFVNAKEWMSLLDAGVGLAAIALRHAGTSAEIRRFFEGYGPAKEKPETVDEIRNNVATAMLSVFDTAAERTATTIGVGRSFGHIFGQHLPAGHPYRFETKEEVPEELAKTAALMFDGDILVPDVQNFMTSALPIAARAKAEDFYYPRDVMRAWMGAWNPEETVERMQRFATHGKSVPVRAVAAPGRNDPCTCGSGKKWKKCHGAA